MGMRVIGLRRSGPGAVADVEAVYGPEGLRRGAGAKRLRRLLPAKHAARPTICWARRSSGGCSGAYFVNVGRGQVVDEAALARALREGWIAGAGLDVFEQEPLPEDSPLWDLPNVLLMPHVGGDSARFMERCTTVVVENLRRYAEGRPLLNVVDLQRRI